ncbi:MAG: Pyridoxamine 5'-phosphate oxidase [Deltaproteobacteria bacterium ADurb.BinA179]|nr:MAG: Pyridoxamine 5'-phosphate oxidase [Deltaproteobacteria bacterium ADurb.BinA179]HOE72703.1 pyridoxamine 5'-phosphate oxidase family protein [Deltaproteobacteria bacterium]HRR70084.1 pyridoxamine 5'-phosphate oxidase family protein [Desulfomonilia bacterium]HON60789.1 pyridoxamine 5'-phosphate oxidase family protein [Deltaproteobacteria bacterium]HPV28143.1 pyridoxamine 5'-phosphate oxidase family protein [Deltaproteobacteria bacterium]
MDSGSQNIGLTDRHRLTQELCDLFINQLLAVLSTSNNGRPYCNLVAFASGDGIASLIFATARDTRKFANLAGDPRVCLLIDNRSNRASDFRNAVAVTATGSAAELAPGEKTPYQKLFLDKHPHLLDFVLSPGCALIKVQVDTYYIVKRFQHVMILPVTP